MLVVEVVDDGVGGADVHGSGIQGLQDRVGAAGGRLQLHSPAGRGHAHPRADPDRGRRATGADGAARGRSGRRRSCADAEGAAAMQRRRAAAAAAADRRSAVVAAVLVILWALTGAAGLVLADLAAAGARARGRRSTPGSRSSGGRCASPSCPRTRPTAMRPRRRPREAPPYADRRRAVRDRERCS